MQIERTEMLKITITGGDRLDPVTVFIEDHETGRGEITIKCYGESWSAGWGAMGDNNVASFICSCDEHYIANKLSGVKSSIDDFDGLPNYARNRVCKCRAKGDITKPEARSLFDLCENLEGAENLHQIESEMHEIFGSEWWYDVPTKSNPDYEYLCRIILCVQEALKQPLPTN